MISSPRFRAVALAVIALVACAEPMPLTGTGGDVTFTRDVSELHETDKVDVLLVLDDPGSVASAQAIEGVRALIRELATPRCIDGSYDRFTGDLARPEADYGLECERGSTPFRPIVDIHVGAVSARGSSLCGFVAWLLGVERNLPRTLPRGATVHVELDAFEKSLGRLARSSGDGCGVMERAGALGGDLVRPDSILALFVVGEPLDPAALEAYVGRRPAASSLTVIGGGAGSELARPLAAWSAEVVEHLTSTGCGGCLPAVPRGADGRAPCVMLEALPRKGDRCEAHGMSAPAPEVLAAYVARRTAEGERPEPGAVCLVEQLTTPPGTTCRHDPIRRGWCLVESTPDSRVSGACRQTTVLSPKAYPPNGARLERLCSVSRTASGDNPAIAPR